LLLVNKGEEKVKLLDWKGEEQLIGTSCAVVSFDIDYYVERRTARGEVSVTFETMPRIITSRWVANYSDEHWVVSMPTGKSDFFDQATNTPVFTPSPEANSGIEKFIAGKLQDLLIGCIGSTVRPPHEVAPDQGIWCNPT
jgi:hypothetical protein